ncbi:type I-B CRISPR-associated protein Cas5b [Rufibacter sp. XAAS-G3-1]|uniref:type I-B CRISPR-associated protein Cas5b n=1 Tax=Rufibacter sp. XAAS-G3-1 TaxID=2729134 RepID=UPI0015E72E26|nr:type I-B CRISPR-associated protein Cas5b [Rufibacter sp. XAAS-G3-1]
MNYKDFLIFDISSEYGHFRKFNTTTSPLTYSIPTRPAIAGLIGAIVGIERETRPNKYKEGAIPLPELLSRQNASIAVQILAPVKKTNIGFNLVSTKNFRDYFNINDKDATGSIKDTYRRTQIEFELLKNPSFRIFISWEYQGLFQKLIENVKQNRTHFTPYLGLSQFTAQLTFIDTCQAELVESGDYEDVVTAINLSKVRGNDPIQFDYEAGRYTSDTMPIEMRADRIVTDYADVLVETNGKTTRAKLNNIYKAQQYGNISFL